MIQVRIHVSRTGRVDRIEVVRGDEALLPLVREGLAGVEFDPALRNGEPFDDYLPLHFAFPPEDPPGA